MDVDGDVDAMGMMWTLDVGVRLVPAVVVVGRVDGGSVTRTDAGWVGSIRSGSNTANPAAWSDDLCQGLLIFCVYFNYKCWIVQTSVLAVALKSSRMSCFLESTDNPAESEADLAQQRSITSKYFPLPERDILPQSPIPALLTPAAFSPPVPLSAVCTSSPLIGSGTRPVGLN